MPLAFSVGHRESPVHEVANVGENRDWRASGAGSLKRGEVFGHVADGFASAIGDSSQPVPQQLSLWIGGRRIVHKLILSSWFSEIVEGTRY